MRLSAISALALWAAAAAAQRPNFLWITLEDLSPRLGAYRDRYASTPNIDRFAGQSVRYNRAFSNGGACAPARSTLITGMYPPSIGTHHMRSEGRPPAFVRGFTEPLREAGYYCSNHSKTDYNWKAPAATWDAIDDDWRARGWRNRGDKPFFTVINVFDTHSSQTYHPWASWKQRREALPAAQRHDPAAAPVPPYYPDSPETREILARYADNVSYADRLVGEILEQLERDGLADDTIVFLFSDHGTGLPRDKGFVFESSTRVPLLIRFPEAYDDFAPLRAGASIDRLVAFVDFAPTMLSLAGVEAPSRYQGRAFLGPAAGVPRRTVIGYRDRMDERYEFIRSIRDGRFKYIRNYFPHMPWFRGQTRLYPSTNPLLTTWHRLARQGALKGASAVYMATTKPREQLFDLLDDPDEIRDLSGNPAYAGALAKMRRALGERMIEIGDLGFLPEGEMWRRFDGRAAEAAAADPDAYPLERIMRTADWVGLSPSRAADQAERLADPDSTVRFWAAVGLAAQPPEAIAGAKPALRKALGDEAPDVAVAAAETLCGAGECDAALDRLDELARPAAAEMRKFIADVAALEGREFFSRAGYAQWAIKTALAELDAAAR